MLFGKHLTADRLFCLSCAALAAVCFFSLIGKDRKTTFKICACGYITVLSAVLFLPVAEGGILQFNLTFRVTSVYNIVHLTENALLFVPPAFLIAAINGRPLYTAIALVAFSLAAECLQLFVPGRVADVMDAAANAAGAFAGAAAASVAESIFFGRKNEIRYKGSMLPRDKFRG